MHEVPVILMRSTPGWIEDETSDATFVFQYKDAVMTIFPDGSWRRAIPKGLKQAVSEGDVNDSEKFLTAFAAVNPL